MTEEKKKTEANAKQECALDSILQKLNDLDLQLKEQQVAIQRLESQKPGALAATKGFAAFATKTPETPPVPKYHKPDFPKFDGKSDPLTFLHRCEAFFRGYRVLEEEKVWMASIHLLDAAQIWYMQVESNHGTPSWKRFTELINLRFGPPLRSNPLGDLAACRRIGTVTEYCEQFLSLLARAGPLTEEQQVQLFTVRLQPPLSIDVQIQAPRSLEVAMNLARSYEIREQIVAQLPRPSRASYRTGILPSPATPLPLPAPPIATTTPAASLPVTNTTQVAGRTVRRLSPAEMDERRRLGQCFNCDEKYVRGHNQVCKRLFLLELSEEPDEAESADLLQISLCAITGIKSAETMQIVVCIGNRQLRALLDSGSSHNFISDQAATQISLPLQSKANLFATVANGDRVRCAGVFNQAEFSVEGDKFHADIFVLPLGSYDIVLGTQWLSSLGPILWDFGKLTMSFWHDDHQVIWRGIPVGSCALIQSGSNDMLLDQLLEEFATVFQEPKGLPPQRSRDHKIELKPGAQPVAVRPYRYTKAQKDELVRQCRAMEEQGLIRRSKSPYSSPVLLVMKPDGSWRFCVDYRALNDLTVKDKFPIPVVEELLDELHGAQFFTKLDLRSGYHQVRMHPADIEKTAFRTHDDLFEFLVMPFGLTNAPATFRP